VVTHKGINYPIIYLFIYRDMKEKAHRGSFIPHRILIEILKRRLYRIPRMLNEQIIKEMEELKLIKKVGVTNKIRYELIAKNIDKLLNQYIPIYF